MHKAESQETWNIPLNYIDLHRGLTLSEFE